jgi:HAMP domain-containing protein
MFAASKLNGKYSFKYFMPVNAGDSATPWSYMAVVPVSEVMASANRMILYCIIIALFFLTGISIASYYFAESIIKPLKETISMADAIAEGNLTVTVPDRTLGRPDEIGQMSRALQTMITHLSSIIGKVRTSSGRLSASSADISTATRPYQTPPRTLLPRQRRSPRQLKNYQPAWTMCRYSRQNNQTCSGDFPHSLKHCRPCLKKAVQSLPKPGNLPAISKTERNQAAKPFPSWKKA